MVHFGWPKTQGSVKTILNILQKKENGKDNKKCKGHLSWDPMREISCKFEGIFCTKDQDLKVQRYVHHSTWENQS